MYELFRSYCINFTLFIFNIYINFLKNILYYTGSLMTIYYIKNNKLTNITLPYYLNYNLYKYLEGEYYIKIYSMEKTDHFVYKGTLLDLKKINLTNEELNFKRKKFILYDKDKIIKDDLNIIDNYYKNLNYLSLTHQSMCTDDYTKLKNIFLYLGIKCTHIEFINFLPFSKYTLPIDDMSVQALYDPLSIKS